eukprot:CAMPEP_0115856624 /NCGR_PEP_ID=MMETSP0287-20121206/15151_1 /TAXON_ID=412157 /ORGANISM="Chrysochromulina rotalis, Strain UIO044" /LENGTH=81 /DNA_ID=CAMNT_0003310809 /DNA_START=276 /DNA_END=521 /DNA_ORIENTATION=-
MEAFDGHRAGPVATRIVRRIHEAIGHHLVAQCHRERHSGVVLCDEGARIEASQMECIDQGGPIPHLPQVRECPALTSERVW